MTEGKDNLRYRHPRDRIGWRQTRANNRLGALFTCSRSRMTANTRANGVSTLGRNQKCPPPSVGLLLDLGDPPSTDVAM